MRWKLLGAAVIALGAIAFLLRWQNDIHDSHAQKAAGSGQLETTAVTSHAGVTSPESHQYKSKIRLNQRPTREETAELLRNTMIPAAMFEDISIREVLNELNRLAAEAGIPPEQLKFVRGAPHVFPDDYLELRVRELKVKNISLANLVRYTLDRGKIVYVIHRGVVEFRDIHAPPDHSETVPPNSPEKASLGHADPFAQ